MKPYKEQTYYELLEVDASATMDEIRGAWERAIRVYDAENVALYPVGDPAQVEELKKLLLEAMEILTDPDLRIEYDNSLGLAPPWMERVKTALHVAPDGKLPTFEAVTAALENPPEPSEIDARAAEARKSADAHLESDLRAHEAAPPAPPAPKEHKAPRVAESPPASQAQHAQAQAEAKDVDDRAEEARAEADAAADKRDDPAPAPSQLVMQEVVSRADREHTHTTSSGRFSVSYLPHVTRPVAESRTDLRVTPEEPARTPTPATPAAAATPSAAAPSQPVGPPEQTIAPQPEADVSTPSRAPAASVAASAANGPAPSAAPPDAAAPAPPVSPPNPDPQRQLEQAPVLAQESAIAQAESAMAKVSAHVAARAARSPSGSYEARPRAFEIPPDADINGELLRQVRKSRGLTLAQLCDRTRISSRHLENVEADRYDQLPPVVYLRGILMNVARELGLDPLRVSKGYLSVIERELGKRK